MYQNSRVMLEMADYAFRHCGSVNRELVEALRSDAMQIRVCVLMALAQYAFSQASEGVRVNAFRAASMYTGMAARMTQLLQENAAMVVPDFVAAMVSIRASRCTKPRLRPGFLLGSISRNHAALVSRYALICLYSDSLRRKVNAGAIPSTCSALRPPTIAAVMAG